MFVKIGEKVKLHRPENTWEYPRWLPTDDQFDGMETVVTEVIDESGIFDSRTCVRLEGCGESRFNAEWLEFFEPAQGFPYRPIYQR